MDIPFYISPLLASPETAIAYNRDTYDILVQLERESGWSFQDKKSLGSLLDS